MKQRVLNLISECCALCEPELTEETLLAEISLDSLGFVRLVVRLEAEFGIEFDDEELNFYEWNSVRDILVEVEEKMGKRKI